MDIKATRELLRMGKTIYDLPLRVGYYARVSTDKDDQLNSLENQQHYFEEMIQENKNWIFSGAYIDEGISGTAVKRRTAFLKMIEAATMGQIDLVLTKEISRFSRNTVDSIKYTEYLLKNGVIVYFLADNLNTIQEDAEFRLTIMSSLAQDEVRKLSERVKFGINRMIKERKLIGGNLTGYYKKNGKYKVNPQEAPIIKYLFEIYVTGNVGLKKISQDLAQMGYVNAKGNPYSQTTLAKFLTNPRYKGYYTARLTEVEDYKTHKKRKVPREKQVIEKDERIPALISEELWNQANQLYHRKRALQSRHILNADQMLKTSKYSCLIHCQHCENIFIRTGGSNRKKNPSWVCQKYKKEGVASCASPIIPEDYLDKIFVNIFEKLLNKRKEYLELIIHEYENIISGAHRNNDQNEINKRIKELTQQKDKLLDLFLTGIINEDDFKKRHDKLNTEMDDWRRKLGELNNENLKVCCEKLRVALINKFNLREQLPNLIKTLIEKVIVEKINNDRKHVRLIIYFNCKMASVTQEILLTKQGKWLTNLIRN